MKLTEMEASALRWMVVCNKIRLGFLYPTVKRTGPLAELQRLIENGFATLPLDARKPEARGYWITDAGRTALSHYTEKEER